MVNESKIIELVNDWVKLNPAFKKKFLIEHIYIIPNKLAQVTTQPTTKTNQTLLQRFLPSFLKYLSINVDKVFVTNLLEDFDFVNFMKKYLLSVGLKESDFTMKITNPSPHFTDIDVLVNINVLKLVSLKNLQRNEEGLFLYDLLGKKYRGQFSYDLKFTEKLNNSINQMNEDMVDYLSRTKYWNVFEPMNPTIGIFKGSSDLEIFIDDFGKEHLLDRVLDGFFKFLGLERYKDWRTYRRGTWLDEKEVEYGLKN